MPSPSQYQPRSYLPVLTWIKYAFSFVLVDKNSNVFLIIREIVPVRDMPRQQNPDGSGTAIIDLQRVLRIGADREEIFDRSRSRLPYGVRGKRVLEQRRVPIDVEDIEEMADGFVVDPEYAVVELLRIFGIIIQRSAHFWGPAGRITFRIPAFPSEMRPRILEQE